MYVLETNDEHRSEAKDQEVEIVEKNVKGLDEIKSNDFKNEDPIILVGSNIPKFINFIGVEIFNWVVNFYLLKLISCLKKSKKLRYSRYLFS